MIRHALEVFADYHQFYVSDGGDDVQPPFDYSDEDVRTMVNVVPKLVAIQPVRNMTVPVEVEVHDADPGFDAASWDHVVECDLDVPSGRLLVHECGGDTKLDIQVRPGAYRVRALFSGLGTLSPDGLDGDDRYRVTLWPGGGAGLAVRKQWAR